MLANELMEVIVTRKQIDQPNYMTYGYKTMEVFTTGDKIIFQLQDNQIPEPQLLKRIKAYASSNGFHNVHIKCK